VNITVPPAYTGNGVWTNLTGGDWLFSSNWNGGNIAYGTGYTADFSTLSLATNPVVTLNSAWRIGNVTYADQSGQKHPWTLQTSSGATLELSAATPPVITVNTPVTWDLPCTGTNGFSKSGTEMLTLLQAASFPTGQCYVAGGSLNFAGTSSLTTSFNFNITNGALLVNTPGTIGIANYLEVGGLLSGTTGTGAGAVNQSSGTMNVGGSGIYLELGVGTSAFGSYQLNDGSLNLLNASGMRIGASGLGLLLQSGGNLDCGRYFALGSGTGGASAGGGRGQATFTGGTANLGSANYRVILGDKTASTSILNIGTAAGGSAVVKAASTSSGNWGIEFLDVAGATMTASLNLNAGTLQTVGPLWRNTANNTTGSAYLNFNGGILQAGANQAVFIPGTLTRAAVYAGGAKLDSGGFQITNAMPLINAPGLGLYPAGGTWTVPNGGQGYRGVPWVTVSGGSGSNAQAIAQIQNGILTRVVITCPGENYQVGDLLTVSFTGGLPDVAAAGFNRTLTALDLGTNGTGGLQKFGTGSLTLAAATTLNGNSLVQQGTLNVVTPFAGNGSLTVINGNLSGTGPICQPVTVQSGGTLQTSSDTLGSLTISNGLNLLPGAVCRLKTDASVGNADQIRGLTQVRFSGQLVLTNLTGQPTNGMSFKLFDAATYQGDFDQLNPAAPGPGLAWNTRRLLTDGRVDVLAVNLNPTPLTPVIQANQLQLSWPTDHTGWRLQMQVASPATGLGTNWQDVGGTRNTNNITLPLDISQPGGFYRLVFP
ncbi:MAG TPA: hypothetical protein VF607_00440, partial [Verrucomicrobiae bacterium]